MVRSQPEKAFTTERKEDTARQSRNSKFKIPNSRECKRTQENARAGGADQQFKVCGFSQCRVEEPRTWKAGPRCSAFADLVVGATT